MALFMDTHSLAGGVKASDVAQRMKAYGIPRPGRMPVVIDQATSSTAFVNIRRAAEAGEPIPAGWALGPPGATDSCTF